MEHKRYPMTSDQPLSDIERAMFEAINNVEWDNEGNPLFSAEQMVQALYFAKQLLSNEWIKVEDILQKLRVMDVWQHSGSDYYKGYTSAINTIRNLLPKT